MHRLRERAIAVISPPREQQPSQTLSGNRARSLAAQIERVQELMDSRSVTSVPSQAANSQEGTRNSRKKESIGDAETSTVMKLEESGGEKDNENVPSSAIVQRLKTESVQDLVNKYENEVDKLRGAVVDVDQVAQKETSRAGVRDGLRMPRRVDSHVASSEIKGARGGSAKGKPPSSSRASWSELSVSAPKSEMLPRSRSKSTSLMLPFQLFSRGNVMQWPPGVSPSLLYAREIDNDGHGKRGLRPTLLADISDGHDPGNLVYQGCGFTMRLVGTHVGNMARCDSERIVYSIASLRIGSTMRNGAPNVHYDYRCEQALQAGQRYVNVSHTRSLVARASSRSGVTGINVRFGLVVVGANGAECDSKASVERTLRELELLKGERGCVAARVGQAALDMAGREGRVVDVDVKWDLAKKGRKAERGAFLLRFGYYFLLARPCEARLFSHQLTPENVRLCARRMGDGKEACEISDSLSYIVLRISEM